MIALFRKRKAKRELVASRLAAKQDLERYVASLADADGCMSPSAIEKFWNYRGLAVMLKGDSYDAYAALALGLANGGAFMRVTDSSLVLREDEPAVYEAGANLMKEVTDREFRGGTQGVSVLSATVSAIGPASCAGAW